jgi:hypothetical protein
MVRLVTVGEDEDTSLIGDYVAKALPKGGPFSLWGGQLMAERLLVMNGRKIVQGRDASGTWVDNKVEKAGELRAGLYNLHTATDAAKNKTYEGIIVHVDEGRVFQHTASGVIRHDLNVLPAAMKQQIGKSLAIGYDAAGAVVKIEAAKKRTRSR